MSVIALFGPTGAGKTAVALELADRLRARGEDPVAVSCDALQVYEGLTTLTGAATADEQRRLEHRLVGFVSLTEPFSVGDYMPLAHAEIDRALAEGRRPIVVGGTGLYLRAALADLSLTKAPAGAEDSELWSPETRHPTRIVGLTMERQLLYRRIDERVEAIVAGGAMEEVRRAEALGPGRTARKALGFSELLEGDVERMKRRSRNYARRQMTWMRKTPGVERVDMTALSPAEGADEVVRMLDGSRERGELRHGPPPRAGARGITSRAVKFEKWNALGNDYAIVEATALPFELTPERARMLCEPHSGIGADGVLLLEDPDDEGFVARLRIFNPDGSEAELSGNGVREAVMYLRRSGWTDRDSFGIQTAAGEIRPRITGPATCTVDMGRAKLTSKDFPTGPEDGRGMLIADGAEYRFQHVSIGNPQCAIEWPDGLDDLDLRSIGPALERHQLFPNRTNVSFWRRESDDEIAARIFERGAGETMSSGTGATGAAVAAVLGGLDSPVTVHLDGGDLEVEVGEDLHVNLTGWAVPVYAGELSPEFLEALRDA